MIWKLLNNEDQFHCPPNQLPCISDESKKQRHDCCYGSIFYTNLNLHKCEISQRSECLEGEGRKSVKGSLPLMVKSWHVVDNQKLIGKSQRSSRANHQRPKCGRSKENHCISVAVLPGVVQLSIWWWVWNCLQPGEGKEEGEQKRGKAGNCWAPLPLSIAISDEGLRVQLLLHFYHQNLTSPLLASSNLEPSKGVDSGKCSSQVNQGDNSTICLYTVSNHLLLWYFSFFIFKWEKWCVSHYFYHSVRGTQSERVCKHILFEQTDLLYHYERYLVICNVFLLTQ